LHIMCDVPTKAVFCSESVESFPGIASKFYSFLLFWWLHVLRYNHTFHVPH
jgi:hypothetical protein